MESNFIVVVFWIYYEVFECQESVIRIFDGGFWFVMLYYFYLVIIYKFLMVMIVESGFFSNVSELVEFIIVDLGKLIFGYIGGFRLIFYLSELI